MTAVNILCWIFIMQPFLCSTFNLYGLIENSTSTAKRETRPSIDFRSARHSKRMNERRDVEVPCQFTRYAIPTTTPSLRKLYFERLVQTIVDTFTFRIVCWVTIISPTRVVRIDLSTANGSGNPHNDNCPKSR